MSISIKTSSDRPTRFETGLLVVPVAKGGRIFSSLSPSVKDGFRKRLIKLGFKGELESVEILPEGTNKAALVAFVGLGKLLGRDKFPEERWFDLAEGIRREMGRIVREAGRCGVREIAVDLKLLSEAEILDDKERERIVGAVVDGILLAGYSYSEYSERVRRSLRTRGLRKVVLLVDDDLLRYVRLVVRRRMSLLKGVELTRDLVNRPAEDVRPKTLVEEARRIADQDENISCSVYDGKKAGAKGFNAFLSVAKGSKESPYVIHLKYRPAEEANKRVIVIGKGITFDSGGLNVKPPEGMETMKIDMAGAATVLGVFSVLSLVGCPVEVEGIIATCENMPGSGAYRPGDVVTARNGKTIEVINTDAEGRITLADALSFAAESKPDAIVDVATLTGACVVGLGETYAGLWSNDHELAERIEKAAQKEGEGLTVMPLPSEYRPMIESRVADVRNTAMTKMGGAITAALFLNEFVEDVPWAHLDVAGPAFLEKELLPYYSPGATGYGVRMIADFLASFDN